MNPERPGPHEEDPEPYWQADIAVGEIELAGDRYALRMAMHRSREQYRDHRELVPLRYASGERLYLHARPYILIPDFRMTVEVATSPTQHNGNGAAANGDRLLGEVVAAGRVGQRPRRIGNAQGWCYPEEGLIMYWECVLDDWCRQEDPASDALLQQNWSAVEELLVECLPEAERIVTPSWESVYRREDWQAFLRGQGYEPESPAVFRKQLPRTETVRKT